MRTAARREAHPGVARTPGASRTSLGRCTLPFAALWLAVTACGEELGSGPPPEPLPEITVRFEYHAPTATDLEVVSRHQQCAAGIGVTHIHPSWQAFRVVELQRMGADRWVMSFDDVPVGARRIRISDPNACSSHPTGAVTALAIFANGVLLTERVETPGEGTEPGFGFVAHEDGSITSGASP